MDTQLTNIACMLFMLVGVLITRSPCLTVEVAMSAEAACRLKSVINLAECDGFIAVHDISQ